MSVKKYLEFIKEAEEAPTPPPPAAQAPAQPTAQPPAQGAQPPAQAQTTGSTETPQSTGTTQGQAQTGEEKSGDLSTYSNEEITKFPDTVKKMVDLLKDMDKAGLVKVRNLIAEIKGIGDAKTEIGKL